jgi:Glycosyl transferases group 1
MARPLRALVLFACTPDNSTFSYQRAWPRHLAAHPSFACTSVNVADRRLAARLELEWRCRQFRGDLVVVLHSVFSNALMLSERVIDALARLPQPKVYFVGNEYKLMPEKMAFCQRLGVGLLVSQSLSPEVHALYQQRLGCVVVGVPNTGLDVQLFAPTNAPADRPIDLGYRAADAPPYLGHQERRQLAEFFSARAAVYHVSVDISLAAEDRFDECAWAAFLNRCKGQLGSEAGGDYFDLDDRSRLAVGAYLGAHPGTSFDDIAARFFPPAHEHVPLRILSGRQVEAAGTKTAQVLFEGRYDGLFEADTHYIPLKKDFSDADEAMRKFKDASFRDQIVEQAYAFVRKNLTYDRLIERFRAAVAPLV